MLNPDRLRQARIEKGWSISLLAQKLGLYPSTVWRWENGLSSPLPAHLKKLSKLLEIPIFGTTGLVLGTAKKEGK